MQLGRLVKGFNYYLIHMVLSSIFEIGNHTDSPVLFFRDADLVNRSVTETMLH